MPELPDDQRHDRGERDRRENRDEVRCKPVIFLTFVEHYLQTADPEHDQAYPDVVNTVPAMAAALLFHPLFKIGRILDEMIGEQQRDNSYRHIDIEDPAPAVVVGNPTAQRRSD